MTAYSSQEVTGKWDIRHLYTYQADLFIAGSLVLVSVHAGTDFFLGYMNAAYFQAFVVVVHSMIYWRLKKKVSNFLIYFLIVSCAVQFLLYLSVPIAGDIGLLLFILFPITVISFTGNYIGMRCTAIYLAVATVMIILAEMHYISLLVSTEQMLFSMQALIFTIGLGHYAISSQESLARKLDKARCDAEMLAKNRGDFLANMSHEIRTPMNIIFGLCEILHDEEKSVKKREQLQIVLESSDMLNHLINNILDISKAELSTLELEMEPFSLPDVLRRIKNQFQSEIERKQLAFNICCEGFQQDYFMGDALRLQQILTNLVANAIKFTDTGHITLCVIGHKLDDKYQLNFSVEDSGIGFSQNQAHLLLERFHQASSSTTRLYGGTGLGLSICTSILHVMGSKLQAYGEVGKGARFEFSIELESSSNPNEITSPDSQLNHAHILVVDDIAANLIVVRNMLERTNICVTTVQHGYQAIELIQDEFFDAVLMDIQMPDMNGYEVTQEIRKILNAEQLPIIALTANAMNYDKERCLAAGMNDYISKPIQYKTALQVLSKYIGKQDKGDEQTVNNTDDSAYCFFKDGEQLQKAIQDFLNTYQQSDQSLEVILSNSKYHEADCFLHELAGISTYFGLHELISVCKDFQQSISNQALSEFIGLHELFSVVLQQSCETLSLQLAAQKAQSFTD